MPIALLDINVPLVNEHFMSSLSFEQIERYSAPDYNTPAKEYIGTNKESHYQFFVTKVRIQDFFQDPTNYLMKQQ